MPSFLKVARDYGFKTMGMSWSCVYLPTKMVLTFPLLPGWPCQENYTAVVPTTKVDNTVFVSCLSFFYAVVDQLPLY